jgi:hypothetical protein
VAVRLPVSVYVECLMGEWRGRTGRWKDGEAEGDK